MWRHFLDYEKNKIVLSNFQEPSILIQKNAASTLVIFYTRVGCVIYIIYNLYLIEHS